MAVRFLVLHRDRSIRLVTEGLGSKPFHGRVVMLVNGHTLSAGEMVAAFAKENRLARIVGTRTGGQVLGGANFVVGHGFVIRFPAAGGTRGAGLSSKGAVCNPTSRYRCRSRRFGVETTINWRLRSLKCRPCNAGLGCHLIMRGSACATLPTPERAPDWVSVAPGYFEIMQMRLSEGPDFRATDRPLGEDDGGRPVAGVAIVNETFARVYFDGQSLIGRFVTVDSSKAHMEVVGMTADAVHFSVREANHPAVFVPFPSCRQGATLLVRTEGAVPDLPQALRREIQRLDPCLQIWQMAPFQSLVMQQMIRERLLAALSVFFATLALVLAGVGIYGVLNYAVTRERREIGLRLALGARPGHVVTMLTVRLAGMVLVGAVVGTQLGLACGRYIETLVFQVAPTDLSALAPPIVLLRVGGLLAIPASRDPGGAHGSCADNQSRGT